MSSYNVLLCFVSSYAWILSPTSKSSQSLNEIPHSVSLRMDSTSFFWFLMLSMMPGFVSHLFKTGLGKW